MFSDECSKYGRRIPQRPNCVFDPTPDGSHAAATIPTHVAAGNLLGNTTLATVADKRRCVGGTSGQFGNYSRCSRRRRELRGNVKLDCHVRRLPELNIKTGCVRYLFESMIGSESIEESTDPSGTRGVPAAARDWVALWRLTAPEIPKPATQPPVTLAASWPGPSIGRIRTWCQFQFSNLSARSTENSGWRRKQTTDSDRFRCPPSLST